MAIINNAKREINAKIVYYGHEGAGKGTSLRYLYERIKPSLRGELKTLPASGGSLLFFDFCPFEQPVFGGYRIRFHIYTLPGRVANPAAWKMTLKGADGVVLVVDAADATAAKKQSIERLRDYLASYGMSLNDMPAVLQVNKTDRAGAANATTTAAQLEVEHLTACLSTALNGEGVLETFSALSRQIMERVGAEHTLQAEPAPLPPSSVAAPQAGAPPAQPDSLLGGAPVPSPAPPAGGEEAAGVPLPSEPEPLGDLRVTLAAEALPQADGSVRIPLTISFHGQTRRLVLTVAVGPDTDAP
ncbi:GTPase domain-containing protein [Oryzomonas sagensis]|uniref:GTPase domain-containing protein n=1 Tax=Oryzomonas sagensis TaxID=2603857 RepID=A0ABQ6TLG8_9BACT|nr:GTPase domain-containing protein [Oryzomonas sagensis]KAB0669297.1 GTPase domain-containing protein [Oryzomonas sagensis]